VALREAGASGGLDRALWLATAALLEIAATGCDARDTCHPL